MARRAISDPFELGLKVELAQPFAAIQDRRQPIAGAAGTHQQKRVSLGDRRFECGDDRHYECAVESSEQIPEQQRRREVLHRAGFLVGDQVQARGGMRGGPPRALLEVRDTPRVLQLLGHQVFVGDAQTYVNRGVLHHFRAIREIPA